MEEVGREAFIKPSESFLSVSEQEHILMYSSTHIRSFFNKHITMYWRKQLR